MKTQRKQYRPERRSPPQAASVAEGADLEALWAAVGDPGGARPEVGGGEEATAGFVARKLLD